MEYVIILCFGLVFGSFAGATIWRLRARQLVEDAAAGEKVPAREMRRLMPLVQQRIAEDRSRCLQCHHTLAWYDLVPLFSWLSTNGKCRYCGKRIGWFEPLIELGTASLLVALYSGLQAGIIPSSENLVVAACIYALWLAAGVLLVILFAYDSKWFLLPDKAMFPFIAIASVIAAMNIYEAPVPLSAAVDTVLAVAILGGLYLVLWYVSKGKWVGFGDVKLGLGLGLALGDWRLAFLALFLANLFGTLLVLPGLMRGKLARNTQIPFGPLLIAGFVVALLAGSWLTEGYFGTMNSFTSVLLML